MRYLAARVVALVLLVHPDPGNAQGYDILGLPVVEGWAKREYPERNLVCYDDPEIYRVANASEYSRYIFTRSLCRYLKEGRGAVPGSIYMNGTYRTNCYANGLGVSCNTSAPPIVTVPGLSGRAPSIRSFINEDISDCKLRRDIFLSTLSKYGKGWKDMPGGMIRRGCRNVESLQALDVKNVIPD